jgi:16S rRNA (guanine966-N2)-methyltransferase
VRITGGEWRSRRLRGPGRGDAVRPTPDAMRERAFAVLGERVLGARFLDLFSGTGAVGLEALSRGAARVVFVERERSAAAVIAANCASLGVEPERGRLLVRPALAALAELARRGSSFDLAWADPPFASWQEGLEAIRLAFASGVLEPQALACLECPARVAVEIDDLVIERDLAGSASRVVLLRRASCGEEEPQG